MTTYSWPPTVKPVAQVWSQMTHGVAMVSPLSGTVQTISRPGPNWMLDLTFSGLTKPRAGELSALLAKLRGFENRVSLHDFSLQTALGSPGGTPVVSGGGQSGTNLTTSGWTPSANIFLPGDMFSVNGELKKIVEVTNSNGSGLATLVFEPPLRSSPSDAAAIDYTSATGTFILATNQWSIQTDINLFGSASLQFREAFP